LKNNGNGQAKVLNPSEINRLFKELNKNPKHACLFAVCYFTGCRISEALFLETADISIETISFRKSITKGKLQTRTVAINPALQRFLDNYHPGKPGPFFPGRCNIRQFLGRSAADHILRKACKTVGIDGCSTHSFRRSALTNMYRGGVHVRTIQKISGHSDLGTLQLYLEVSDADVTNAINSLSF